MGLLPMPAEALALPAAPRLPCDPALTAFFAAGPDFDEIAALSLQGFGDEALSAATLRRRVLRGHAALFGLRGPDGIAGYLLLYLNQRTRRAYVNEVLVAPVWRGQRLSVWLLGTAELIARQAGMRTFAAHVRGSNTPSLRAKLRQGMVEVERLEGWYPGGEVAIYLKQRL